MQKTYKFRLYPSKKQIAILNNVLNSCRYLYNTQIEYERYVYEKDIRFANRIELNNLLPDLKIFNPSLKKIHSQVLQNINYRVVKSFNNFFNKAKKGKNSGYPRFKNANRYNSFTYPQSGFIITSKNKLKLSQIGEMSIKFHRAIEGKIKTLTIVKSPTHKWFACFSVQQDIFITKRSSNKSVGVDLGLEKFATLSDGSEIKNPRFLERSLRLLQIRSRQFSRKKKSSLNRQKSRLNLVKLYEGVYNQRLDYLHKLTYKLVNEYDCIALEDLRPSEMKNKYLQFSINDVSWNKFRQLLTYKAEEAGCKLDFVNPRDTSKKCSECGNLQEMPLNKREYDCPVCGNSLDRDLNSALNILKKSCFYKNTEGHSGINACGDVLLKASLKQEISMIMPQK